MVIMKFALMLRTCSLVALLLLGYVESIHAEEMEGMLVFDHEIHTLPESFVDSKAKTYVFVCKNQSIYSVHTTATKAWVFRPEGTPTLSSMPVEEGALYSDGSFKLWIKGQTAESGEIGDILLTCHNDRRRAIWEKAKLDGANFRAVGNEPGWNLEIRGKIRFFLVTDYPS